MRSHFLKDLPIAGKGAILEEIPGLDFHNLRRVVKVTWVDENSAEGHRTNITRRSTPQT